MYGETRRQSQVRKLVALALVGRNCAAPLIELINCKFGNIFLFRPAGNLVAIGNILDEYWDCLKDKRQGKQTFLTCNLPEKELVDIEIILRILGDLRAHSLAINYMSRLFSHAMSSLEKDWQEDALAIALFAQIGVLKRRYKSLKNFWEERIR